MIPGTTFFVTLLIISLTNAHPNRVETYGNFNEKSREPYQSYAYPPRNIETQEFYRAQNTPLQSYYYSPSVMPTQQYHSGIYYHPMMDADSSSIPISIQSDSIYKDLSPSQSSLSYPSITETSNTLSNPLTQSSSLSIPSSSSLSSSSPSISSSSSSNIASSQSPASLMNFEVQSTKQSIIFGRSFSGFDDNHYIPVYYPIHWSYDQYPSTSKIQSEYQSSNPAHTWSWTPTVVSQLPISTSIPQQARNSLSMPFRSNPSVLYDNHNRPKIGARSEVHESHLKHSENSPLSFSIIGNDDSLQSTITIPRSIKNSVMNYFIPYTSNNNIIEHMPTSDFQQLPRTILGNVQTNNDLIVAPVFKLQEQYVNNSQQTMKKTPSGKTSKRFYKKIDSNTKNNIKIAEQTHTSDANKSSDNNNTQERSFFRPIIFGQRIHSSSLQSSSLQSSSLQSSSLQSSSSSSSTSSLSSPSMSSSSSSSLLFSQIDKPISFKENNNSHAHFSEKNESHSGNDLLDSLSVENKNKNFNNFMPVNSSSTSVSFVSRIKSHPIFRLPLMPNKSIIF